MNDNKIEKPIEQNFYKHKPQSVAPIINTVVHEDGDVVVAILAKVEVARIMEALNKTTLVSITIQFQITLGTEDVVASDEEACIINQMRSVITAINATIIDKCLISVIFHIKI